ncbi:hypothetical protein COW95_01480 [Candidatus Peregrinibacteria bacterium CG22_combo_CG10-13_8_21_14_all_49_11]|nr:MAG: hypothetical protein COW95_01480 [Candidatus Peregrinibacteria bacterium CG22_combo_CG10-13_8_21_14_all_49_11]
MHRFLSPALLGIVVVLGLPLTALGGPVEEADVCILGGGLGKCSTVLGGGAGEFATYAKETLFFGGEKTFMYIFAGIALAMFAFYAVRMIFFSDDENVITESKAAYGHAIAGCAIMGATLLLLNVFATERGTIIKGDELRTGGGGLNDIIKFFKMALGAALAFNVVLQGSRMIALQGREGEVDKQKKKFFNGLMGVVVVIIADSIIKSVAGDPGTATGGGQSTVLGDEIQGIANFIIEIFGILSVIAFVVAGAMILIATNPETVERAKKLMIGAIVAVAIVISAFAIVNFFL